MRAVRCCSAWRLLKRAGLIAGLALAGYAAGALAGALLDDKPWGVGGKRFLYFAPLVGLVAQRFCAGQMGFSRPAALVLGHGLMVLGVWGFNRVYYPAAGWEPAPARSRLDLGRQLRPLFPAPGGAAPPHAGRGVPAGTNQLFGVPAPPGGADPGAAVYLARLGVSAHALVLTLMLSETTYRLVEAPGIALGRAIERRWLRAVPASPPEAVHAPPSRPRIAA